nr:hypothetical protein [Tanacetum cinerariifolium]
MLTGKWTLMNASVQKFNQLVSETLAHSGENDEDWITRVKILYKTHVVTEFKHKRAWLFLKGKHKWTNPESTNARRNRFCVADEEPKHFGDDALPRPPGLQRITKSQRSGSNSTASSVSNPMIYQEFMKEQYELDRKAKIELIAQESEERKLLIYSQSATTKVKPAVDKKDNPKVKLTVVKEKPVGFTSKVSKGKDDVVKVPVVADEVLIVADKVLVVKATVADKALVVKATVADNVVADKEPFKEKSTGNVGKAPVKDKVKVSLLEGSLAPVKDNVKAPIKDNVEVSVLKGNLLVDVVPDDMILNKAMDKASIKDKFKALVKDKVEDNVKAPVMDNVKVSVKDKPKQKVIPTVQELSKIHFESSMIHTESREIQSDSFESHEIQCESQDNVKAPVKDKPKQKVIPTVQELSEVLLLRSSNQKVKSKVVVHVSRSKETPVKRKMILSKEDDRKKKLKGKSKKEDSDSELETDDVDSSSDEVDRKRKKLKINDGLKRKRSGSDCLDSSSIDTENIKRVISKLEKKVKK